MKLSTFALAPTALLLFACGGSADDGGDDLTAGPPQCQSSAYIAFDPANLQAGRDRVTAFEQMTSLLDEGSFADAQTRYQSAGLRETVTALSAPFDTAILDALDEGRTATTAHAADLAKENVEGRLVHVFFLSIRAGLSAGEPARWDAAFADWGADRSNADTARRGLAALTTERDAANAAQLAETIFNGLVDGSCGLAQALANAGGTSLDPSTVPELSAVIDEVDLDLERAIAFMAAHAGIEMATSQEGLGTDPDAGGAVEVQLLAFELLFQPLEPLMTARGGDSADRAARIRSALQTAWDDPTGRWKALFDPGPLVSDLEDEYGIVVQG